MSNQIQAGTMMVQQSASMRSLGIESEPYSGSWRSLGVLESSGLVAKFGLPDGVCFSWLAN